MQKFSVYCSDQICYEESFCIMYSYTPIDPNGEAFRFATSRRGDQHLKETSTINIEVFGEAMSTLNGVFDFWCDVTSELFDKKMETQS